MFITRMLRSLPLKKQTVVKSLLFATLLFIVYQLTFVAELSESAKPKPLRERLPKHDKKVVAAKERVHPRDIGLINKSVNNEQIDKGASEKKIENVSSKIKEENVSIKMKEAHHVPQEQNDSVHVKVADKKPEPSEVFTCRASGKVIAKDKVDDDYCDCPEDGSDEPRTNACTNTKFSCVHAVRGITKVIPSAWVNDGICDCCDGSDEWQKKVMETFLPVELQKKIGRFLSPCPNRCP